VFLADECLNGLLVEDLRRTGFTVEWIREVAPGIKDRQVISRARQSDLVIITEDKDFGEWVFAHKASGFTVIFLRYTKVEYPEVMQSLVNVMEQLPEESEEHEFITITARKIRRRFI
jgi:predicted nuclease of predicted toxin-antitoxin system